MAEIRPFQALRFTKKAGETASLLCPPYDIISEEERRALLEKNPYNIIRLELPREGTDPYARASETLNTWMADGILAEDKEEGIYVYEESFTVNGSQKHIRGMVALLKLEEFDKGIVLPHENTLSKAKKDRFSLMEACRCNFSLIYGMFSDPERRVQDTLDQIAGNVPENDLVTSDGLCHKLWRCTDRETLNVLTNALADKQIYIADGHHRYETALNYRNSLHEKGLAKEPDAKANYVMVFLIDMENEGLVVFPTHRVVHDLDLFDKAAFLSQAAEYFDLTEYPANIDPEELLKKHTDKPSFVFYAGGEGCTLLTLRDASALATLLPDKSAAYRALDVTALHTLLLNRTFKIDAENMANGTNLTYVRDKNKARAMVDEHKADCVFFLNPTKIFQVKDVAAANDKMPQKSTYFYPKLITGLTMNKLF